MTSPIREAIVAEAMTYLDDGTGKPVRWRHQGRDRRGVDCAGLVACVAHEVVPGFDEDYTTYERWPGQETVQTYANKWAKIKDVREAKPGDVLVMMDVVPGWPCHFAIVSGGAYPKLEIIHSAAVPRPRVQKHNLSPDWVARIVGCYEFHGIED